ncbi:MAG TPA: alpha-isopropylmalate synthase regulatory domain-containing protein, partial [Paludibacteraceae bacterium]|nr:alpha-isopropylmalate synthase regulatory domain-containing protein [Paludibacteraceae bacterium]
DDDILMLAGVQHAKNPKIKLNYLKVTSGKEVVPEAEIGITMSGKEYEAKASGNGPVDAAIKALKQILKKKMVLQEFVIQSINRGSDDIGKVHMQLLYEDKIYYGFGANTDIVVASLEAYIDAINKFKS